MLNTRVVPGPAKKQAWPAHDDPNASHPPPTGKPSAGRAAAEYWIPWADLLRKTVGVDPEICTCGARMVVDDAITDGEKIAEVLARLGIASTGPTKSHAAFKHQAIFAIPRKSAMVIFSIVLDGG